MFIFNIIMLYCKAAVSARYGHLKLTGYTAHQPQVQVGTSTSKWAYSCPSQCLCAYFLSLLLFWAN